MYKLIVSQVDVVALRYLQDALITIDSLLKLAVERVAEAGGDPNESLRGLVFSDDDVQAERGLRPTALISREWGLRTSTIPRIQRWRSLQR